jgi:hypothetical protein
LSFFTFAFLAGCSAKSKGSGRIGYLLTAPGMRSFAPILCRVSTFPLLLPMPLISNRGYRHAADPRSFDGVGYTMFSPRRRSWFAIPLGPRSLAVRCG